MDSTWIIGLELYFTWRTYLYADHIIHNFFRQFPTELTQLLNFGLYNSHFCLLLPQVYLNVPVWMSKVAKELIWEIWEMKNKKWIWEKNFVLSNIVFLLHFNICQNWIISCYFLKEEENSGKRHSPAHPLNYWSYPFLPVFLPNLPKHRN